MPKKDKSGHDEYIHLSRLRDQGIREARERGERLLNNPYHFKLILNTILIRLLSVPEANDTKLALEFWAIVNHLFEGKPLSELPTTLLNKEILIIKINKIIRGETIKADEDDEDEEEHE